MATPVPKTSLTNLRCCWCNKYLSVPPINMVDDKFTCGRCNPNGKRVTIYEELLKFLQFPCAYANCPTVLGWGQVKNHEKTCLHKSIFCPQLNCKQQVEVKSIEKHYIKSHLDFFQPNPASLTKGIGNEALFKNFKPEKKVLLMTYNDNAYLVFILSSCTQDTNCKDFIHSYGYKFGAFSVDNHKNKVKCSVTLRLISGTVIQAYFKETPVQPFNENVHCFQCLLATCPLKHHKKTNNWLQIKFDKIPKISDMKIEYEIKIYEEQPKVVPEVAQPPNEVPGTSDMAKKLECPICQEFMCTPIYNCARGHTICSACKELLLACPFCKASIGNSRNYILEDIADTLKIPCMNSKKGCPFVGFVKNAKTHEIDCSFNKK